MGRQLNFYMTAEDEGAFLEFLRRSGDLAILPHVSPTPEFPSLEVLATPLSAPFWGDLWLCNGRPRARIVARFVPERGYYVVDGLRSELVELSRSYQRDKAIHRGRIWAELAYLDPQGEAWVPKPSWFIRWYESMVKWIRAEFRRIDPLVYAGPEAVKLRERGWKLE